MKNISNLCVLHVVLAFVSLVAVTSVNTGLLMHLTYYKYTLHHYD